MRIKHLWAAGLFAGAALWAGCGESGAVCGEGTVEEDGTCVPEQDTNTTDSVTCGEGTSLSNGECIPDSQVTCGAGTALADGSCEVDDTACADGTSFDTATGECIADFEVVCGAGTQEDTDNGECVPAQDACAPGTTLADNGECVVADPARVQIIHNSPDPAAETVDIFANGGLIADDLGFREATPFLNIPSGVEVEFEIDAAPSDPENTPIVVAGGSFEANQSYIVFANGVLEPETFNDGDDDSNLPGLSLDILKGAYETYQGDDANNKFNLALFHGAPDAPAVDVMPSVTSGLPAEIFPTGLSYGDYTRDADDQLTYLDAPAGVTALELTTADGMWVASYQTSFQGNLPEGGEVAIAFASGLLAPQGEQPEFELQVATPTGGETAPLDRAARVQIVHNSPDAGPVKVTLNDETAAEAFEFRDATPYVTVEADVEIEVDIADGTFTEGTTFGFGSTNFVVADGLIGDSGDGDNPFGLAVKTDAKTMAASQNDTALSVFHGSPNAPAVDVYAEAFSTGSLGSPSFPGAAPGAFTDYAEVPAASYVVTITAAENPDPVAAFTAPLGGFAGQAINVVASGYLEPEGDQPPFALVAVTPDGQTIELGDPAYLQVIHNSGDTNADGVDVYLNGALAQADFGFREATGYLTVPAGEQLVDIYAGGADTQNADPVATTNTPALSAGESHVAVAQGVLDPGNFDTSANNDIGFGLTYISPARRAADQGGEVDLRVVHGATDAPAVNVNVPTEDGPDLGLASDLAYNGVSDSYVGVAAGVYTVNVAPASGGNPVASFDVDLSGNENEAVTVLASGFLTEDNEATGGEEPLGLLAVFSDGGTTFFQAN